MPSNPTHAEAVKALKEIAKLPDLKIELSRDHAFCLVGQIQLALRHPDNKGPSTIAALKFILAIRDEMPEVLKKSIDMGFDPSHDQAAPNPGRN